MTVFFSAPLTGYPEFVNFFEAIAVSLLEIRNFKPALMLAGLMGKGEGVS
jgi:hypothetical protein